MIKTSNRPLHIVIVGNGIAGITAARTIRKLSQHRITVISAESPYFFSRTALMYVYMGHMRWKDIVPYEHWFWGKNKIELIQDHVDNIDREKKQILLQNGNTLSYDKLILATGSASNRLGIPGEEAERVTGLYSRQDLERIDAMSASIRKAVVIGGGLIGIELCEMFRSRNIPVTFLVRESGFHTMILPPEESAMINDHIREHGVDLRLEKEVVEINCDEYNHVTGVTTHDGEFYACDFVGVTIGVHPNIAWLQKGIVETNKGFLVNSRLETSQKDIYAIGDCAELRHPPAGHKSIEPVWYTGRMMGETVAHTICGRPTDYNPGIWFNSAKFFDIEYQVYGHVHGVPSKSHLSVFYMHPEKKRSIRICYNKDGHVEGFNLLGTRFRQEVCEKWIASKTHIEQVLAQLELAVFDAEFSKNACQKVRDRYFEITGVRIAGSAKPEYNRVYRFLKSSILSSK